MTDCGCDNCLAGPYYTDSGLLIHWCDSCHIEYADDEGCPECLAFDRAYERSKYMEN